MDNQQVTDYEFGWLAGIIDGEGHVSMRYWNFRQKRHYTVEIAITNTSKELLEKVESICNRLGIGLHWQQKATPKRNAPCWDVGTKRIVHCYKILSHILPLLTSKKPKAELLFSFCKRRLGFAEQCRDNGSDIARLFPYTEEDLYFFEEFKKLTRNFATPTTISQESRNQEIPKRGTGNALAVA